MLGPRPGLPRTAEIGEFGIDALGIEADRGAAGENQPDRRRALNPVLGFDRQQLENLVGLAMVVAQSLDPKHTAELEARPQPFPGPPDRRPSQR